MALLHWAFAVSVSISLLNACLNMLLKRAYRAERADGCHAPSDDGILRATSIASMVCACLAFVMHFAIFFIRPLSKRGWAAVAVLFSLWTPPYFIFLLLQDILLSVIAVSRKRSDQCDASVSVYIAIAVCMKASSLLLTGACAICCDLDSKFTPCLRRAAYSCFALVKMLDVIGSCLWGNALESQSAVVVGSFLFVIDDQITSCIFSNFIVSLHFLYVSSRSHNGRGWAFASLRFVLQDDAALLNLTQHGASTDNPTEAKGVQSQPFIYFRLRQRLMQFQRSRLELSSVFAIPVKRIPGVDARADLRLELERPLFDLKILRPLQRLAENHPAPYFCVIALLGFSSLGSSFVRDRATEAILLLVFNSSTFIVGMGFFTCRRQNIDRVAAKHVVLSFRFLSCVGFLAAFIAISTLSAIAGRMLWLKVASRVMLTLPFFVCAMLDCSPRPSALTQFIISVRVHYLQMFCCSKLIQVVLQAIWCSIFGYWTFIDIQQTLGGDAGECFFQIGSFNVCEATALLSIHSNLFLLMAQALLSRMFAPGRSNFVNSSVSDSARRNFLFESSSSALHFGFYIFTHAAADFELENAPNIQHRANAGPDVMSLLAKHVHLQTSAGNLDRALSCPHVAFGRGN